MKYYKFLNDVGVPMYGVGKWELPSSGNPAKWMPKIEQLQMCFSGYHVITKEHMPTWMGPKLYEVEVRGEHLTDSNKFCWQQARLTKEIKKWNNKTIYQIITECLEKVASRLRDEIRVHSRYNEGLHAVEYFNGNPEQLEADEAWHGIKRVVFLFTHIEALEQNRKGSSWIQQRIIDLLDLD